jgi:hypothetical protein
MIIERGCGILHNCNKKRRLEAPSTETGVISFTILMPGPMAQAVGSRLAQPANLGRLPLNLVFQTLHLVFEAQL